jgi:hypothetical protein
MLMLLGNFLTPAARANEHEVTLSTPFRIRAFSGENMNFLFTDNGEYSAVVAPNFDDSQWPENGSLKSFLNPDFLATLPQEKLFETGVTIPKLPFFSSHLASRNPDSRFYVVRTKFNTDKFDIRESIVFSYTMGYKLAVFVNGNLIGSNFPLSTKIPTLLTDPEFNFHSAYHIPRNFLKESENTLVLVARSSTWPAHVIGEVTLSNEGEKPAFIQMAEYVRLGIPAIFWGAGLILSIFFLFIGMNNRAQRWFLDLALLSFCGSMTFSFLGGAFEGIPLSIVYQRKIFSMFSIFFAASMFRIAANSFEAEGIPYYSKMFRRVYYTTLVILALLAYILSNGDNRIWNYILPIQVGAICFSSALGMSVAYKNRQKLTESLQAVFFAQLIVVACVIESFLNFHFRYWNTFIATWGFLPMILAFAYHYNARYLIQQRELMDLRDTLEEKVRLRTQELEKTTKKLTYTLIKVRNMTQIIDQKSRFREVATLSVHLDHQIRNPLAIIGLSLEELSEDIESSPQEALLQVHKIQKNIRSIVTVLDSLRMFRRFGGENSLKRQVAKRKRQ